MKRPTIVIVLFTALVSFYGCSGDKPLRLSKVSNCITIEIETIAGESGRRNCSKLMKEAVRVFDQRMSLGFGENSVIKTLNAEREAKDLPDEMTEFFERIDQLRQKTNNAWHPATGKIHELWESLDGDLSDSAAQDLSLSCVQTLSSGIRLPGGGKAILHGEGNLALNYALLGWAVDGAAQVLLNGKIPAAFIEAAGVYRFWGQPAPGNHWTFEVKALPDTTIYHLTPDAGGVCRLIDGSMATDSENSIELNRYNPETGLPADYLSSLTAWAPDAISACVYTEAMNVMNKVDMLRWAESHNSVSVFIIDNDLTGAVAESDSRMSAWVSMYLP